CVIIISTVTSALPSSSPLLFSSSTFFLSPSRAILYPLPLWGLAPPTTMPPAPNVHAPLLIGGVVMWRYCRKLGTLIPPLGTINGDRKSTRLNSSHVSISYAVFFLKKKTHS